MADSSTANHSFILPEIGASKDTWGAKLNSNFTALDTLLRQTATSDFLPRTGGGNITGGFIFTAHSLYDARIGQTDFPLTIRRKSDNAIAFRFDGSAGLDGSAPDDRSVLNRAMGDTRYVRPDQPTTFVGGAQATLLIGHTARVFSVRRKTDNVDTHGVFDADITNPSVASTAQSILTRAMGDSRYPTLTGGNTIAGTQLHSGESRYTGVNGGVVGIGGSGTMPFFAQRTSDSLVTHVISTSDISSPDEPAHSRSILTRIMGDGRYARQAADSQFSAEQTFNARALFESNTTATVQFGVTNPMSVVRKSDSAVTHVIPPSDVTSPLTPSYPTSILTRQMGDLRYGTLAASNVWGSTNRFDGLLVGASNTTATVQVGGTNPLDVVRKSNNAVTHTIPPSDVTSPLTPSLSTSILTRQMGDSRYVSNVTNLEGPVTLTRAGSGSVSLALPGVAVQTGGPDQATLSYHMRSRNASQADVCRILANGNVQNANNSYGALSDMRLKEGIEDAGPQLDDLLALRVRHFKMRQGQTHKQIGLIAQEVRQVKPGLVEESPDGMLSVKYSVLVPLLLKAVQELAAEVRRNSPVTTGA